MNLNELRAAGGFIESALVRKEITWTRVPAGRKKAVSDTFQVFVRRNSFGAVERLFSAEGDQQSRNARYLAECIRLGETGEESLTYEQAYDLDPALGFLLLQAVGEVNRVEDAEKTDPRRRGLARAGAERRRRVDHCRGQGAAQLRRVPRLGRLPEQARLAPSGTPAGACAGSDRCVARACAGSGRRSRRVPSAYGSPAPFAASGDGSMGMTGHPAAAGSFSGRHESWPRIPTAA